MSRLRLFLVSFLILYFELLFIRWIPDAVHVLAFMGNFVLLSCFLGMGVGLARPPGERADSTFVLRFLGLASVLVLLLAVFLYYRIDVPPPNVDVFFNDDAFIQGPRPLHVNLYLTIVVFCGLMASLFVPLGTLLRRYLDQHASLEGYSLNILASLAGISFFSLLSYLSTPPPVWLTLGLLLLIPFSGGKRTAVALLSGVLILGTFVLDPMLEKAHGYEKFWSPYYNLRLHTLPRGDLQIYIGNSCLLTAVDLSRERTLENPHHLFYSFPYRFHPHPKRVLVLGSGMGNDVAEALLQGAEHVDAVEIDPQVARIGLERHPLKPYADPRVTLINDDARHFLNSCQEKYDLIIFGTLDSHGLFSHMSSLKMENYVYTQESFEQAGRLLAPDGVLYLTVGFMGKFVPGRLNNSLQKAFGHEPQFYIFKNLYSMFIAGNPSVQDAAEPSQDLVRARIGDIKASVEAGLTPTDDWPQLYLARRSIPREYLTALSLLLAVSLAMVWLGVPKSTGFKLNGHYFFLGAGFMLLETKSITELGLLFGSTWLVNSIVIGLILTMIFLANLYLLKASRKPSQVVMYALLFMSIAGLYFGHVRHLAVGGGGATLTVTVVLLTVPLLFAALIFGTSFKRTTEPGKSLASNILGSMVGGALEYTSMVWGLQALYLVALGLYALSFAFRRQA
ncbi:MAG: hypothetical protein AMXMBFR33_25740 [Candidatus Xenobia bacterium]|jgi:SAM-dependent methyltransferase